jgi:hypothetical protein
MVQNEPMKSNAISIQIKNPCTQNWDEMLPRDGQRFCQNCEQPVIDFTNVTNAEIINMLTNTSSKVCGRFTTTQLDQLSYQLLAVPERRNWLKYIGVLAISASIFLQSCDKIDTVLGKVEKPYKNGVKNTVPVSKIYGYLINEENEALADYKVKIANTKMMAVTDKDGRYEIRLEKKININNNKLFVEFNDSLAINFYTERQDTLKISTRKYMVMGAPMIIPPDHKL